MYRAAKRDTNERAIINYLERVGAQVKQLDDPSIPDLLVNYQFVTFLLEVKTKTGTLTVGQKAFMDCWQGKCAVVRSIRDVKHVLRDINMPVYTYECKACNKRFEIIHSMCEKPREICPECDEPFLQRVLVTVPFIIYRGDGWAGKHENSS
jgi:putative FmdB family regulatory protein